MPNSKEKPIIMRVPDISAPDPEILELAAQIRKKSDVIDIDSPYPLRKISDMFPIKEIDISDIITDYSGLEIMTETEMYQKVQFARNGFYEDNFNADSEVAQIKTPITQPGDLWQIGRHRLMYGNPADMSAFSKLMDGKKARMIFTDFSWNVGGGREVYPGWKNRKYMGNKMSAENLREFLLSVLSAIISASEPGANTYIVSSVEMHGDLMFIMEDAGYKWDSTIVWEKNILTLVRKDYHSKYSPIWYGWQNGAERLCKQQDSNQTDCWEISQPIFSDEHPTAKPIELAARAMQCTSKSGDIILDAFGHLGTTLMAAEQTGRTAYLMESDPRYCDIIVLRFAKMQKDALPIILHAILLNR